MENNILILVLSLLFSTAYILSKYEKQKEKKRKHNNYLKFKEKHARRYQAVKHLL